jgi:hypothetical protein
METLQRTKFSAEETTALNNSELLQDAQKLLNYKPAALSQHAARVAHHKNELAVVEVFERLGIEPLDSRTVQKYKHAKLREVTKNQSCAFVRYMHESSDRSNAIAKGETVAFLTTILLVLSAIVTLAIVLPNPAHFATTHPIFAQVLRVYWGFYLSAYAILMYARHKKASTVSASWNTHSLYGYSKAIPDFALDRAVAIKKGLPETEFYVDELTQQFSDLETQKHVPDPFMVMTYKTVTLYLDVWDEPKFEGRRQI